MIEIFPIGILGGFVIGVFLGAIYFGSEYITTAPTGISKLLTSYPIRIYTDEIIGALIGIIASFIFAAFVNAHLAVSFLFGYGVGFSPAVILMNLEHTTWVTYIGHMLLWVICSIIFLLIIAAPISKLLEKVKEALTQPRI